MIQVTASFDDGSILDLKVADLLYQHNIDGVFYIPVNYQKYLTSKGVEPLTPDLLNLLASQFEIGSHGVNHELLTRVNTGIKVYEINNSKDYWEERLLRPITKFCYPRGYFDDNIKKIVAAAGYKSARTVKVGNLSTEYDKFEQPTTVHVGYDRYEYETDWFTYGVGKIKEAIEMANQGKQVEYHFWGHSAEIDKYQQWDRFEKFLKELRALQ